MVSIFCEWVCSDLLRVGAVSIAKELRYDMFLCYFRKCTRFTNPVDKEKNKQFFDLNKIEADISVLEQNISHFMPLRVKRILISLMSIISMFIISW